MERDIYQNQRRGNVKWVTPFIFGEITLMCLAGICMSFFGTETPSEVRDGVGFFTGGCVPIGGWPNTRFRLPNKNKPTHINKINAFLNIFHLLLQSSFLLYLHGLIVRSFVSVDFFIVPT